MPASAKLCVFAAATVLFGWGATAQAGSPQRSPVGAKDSIRVQLLFDGKPLLSKQQADFSCYDYARTKWINCRIKPAAGLQEYTMAGLAPGRYRMHIRIDENENNPDSYPEDYVAIHPFNVASDSPTTLLIDVPRVIHLTAPVDNGRSLEGAFSACDREPDYEAPYLSTKRTVTIPFSWDSIAEAAEYRISVIRTQCDPYGRIGSVISGWVKDTSIQLALPPNKEGEHYQFVIEAFRGDRSLGVFHVHDAGTHGWDYRFRVGLEEPNREIAVVASLAAIFFFCLIALLFMLQSGNRSLAVTSVLVLMVSGWLGSRAYDDYKADRQASRTRLEEARAAAAELQASLNQLFVDEWRRSAPLPEWWNDITLPDYPIDNLGELMSAWQSDFGRGETRIGRERQFFKGAYQAILDHPADKYLVTTAIDLMAYIGRDYPHRRTMLEFAIKHFFDFDRRTDNCADCMVGDRTNSFVEDLSRVYVRAGEYEDAIALIERFKTERADDVSDYAWAGTVAVLGEAYWKSGQHEKAIASMAGVDSSGSEHPDHPNFQRLRERLEGYRREMEKPADLEG